MQRLQAVPVKAKKQQGCQQVGEKTGTDVTHCPQEGTNSADTWMSNIWFPNLQRIHLNCFKSPSLYSFAMAVPGNKYNTLKECFRVVL